MEISIIHPSRSRPAKSFSTITKWILSASHDFEIIISIDSNDPDKKLYYALYQNTDAKIIENNNRSAVDAINNGAKVATGNIFMVVSDDTDCFVGWDEEIIKFVSDKKDWIIKTQDGIQNWIITFPILDRTYYNRFGYIYHPDFLHMFADTELSCVADMTGRRITSNLMFKHQHYSTGATAKDAISEKADSTWSQGERLFIERAKRNFDLTEPHYQIRDQGMVNWLRNHGVK